MNPSTEATPPTGMVQGGWEYVYAAYGLSFSVLIAYALLTTVWLRSARARKEMA